MQLLYCKIVQHFKINPTHSSRQVIANCKASYSEGGSTVFVIVLNHISYCIELYFLLVPSSDSQLQSFLLSRRQQQPIKVGPVAPSHSIGLEHVVELYWIVFLNVLNCISYWIELYFSLYWIVFLNVLNCISYWIELYFSLYWIVFLICAQWQ